MKTKNQLKRKFAGETFYCECIASKNELQELLKLEEMKKFKKEAGDKVREVEIEGGKSIALFVA